MRRLTRLARNLRRGDVFVVRDETGDRVKVGKVRVVGVEPWKRGFLSGRQMVRVDVELVSGPFSFFWPDQTTFYADEKVDIEREERRVQA